MITDSATGFAAARSTSCSARGQDDGDDETIQSEGFSEDHHKNEGDQDISLSVTTNTGITDDTDAKAGGEGGETTAEASTESLVSLIVSIAPFAWVSEVGSSVLDLGDCKKINASRIKDRSDFNRWLSGQSVSISQNFEKRYLLLCLRRIEIMRPYIPSTPAMTTGMIDLKRRSGLRTATETIPTPDLAVP